MPEEKSVPPHLPPSPALLFPSPALLFHFSSLLLHASFLIPISLLLPSFLFLL